MRFVPIFFLIAASLVAPGCNPDVPLNEHYGEILAPGTVETPKDCLAYVTAPNDTTYMLANRFYGAGYRSYLIEAQNKDTLESITLENGTLEKGTVIFLPPDQNGRPLDTQTPEKYYLGGWR